MPESQPRLRVTIEDRRSGKTAVYDIEHICGAFGSPVEHNGKLGVAWAFSFRGINAETTGLALAALITGAARLMGPEVVQHLRDKLGIEPDEWGRTINYGEE